MAETALEAKKMLGNDGISAEVVNVRSVKPFDKETLEKSAQGKKLIVTIEDNVTAGGMGQYIVSGINHNAKVMNLGFDTCFVQHGKQSELFALNGLDTESVYQRIKKNYTI